MWNSSEDFLSPLTAHSRCLRCSHSGQWCARHVLRGSPPQQSFYSLSLSRERGRRECLRSKTAVVRQRPSEDYWKERTMLTVMLLQILSIQRVFWCVKTRWCDQIRNHIFGVSCPLGRGDGCASKYIRHADFWRKTEVPSQDFNGGNTLFLRIIVWEECFVEVEEE